MMRKNEYLNENRLWLEKKASETGVFPLAKGVCYSIINEGDPSGKTPDANSVVTVRYTGKTIDGHVFDSCEDDIAPAFRLRELIPGWIIALQHMHPGDKWEIYIPSEQGYGKRSQPDIPGGSTLIFEIELLAVN